MSPSTRRTLAYGSWPSPLAASSVAAGRTRYSEARVDRGAVYWLEGRPTEGGRSALMRSARDGDPVEVTSPAVDVRSRVHEYGGGAYAVRDGRAFFVDDATSRLVERGRGPLGEAGVRYGDPALHPSGAWLAAVEEREREKDEPTNHLVALATAGTATPTALARIDARHDFVSTPVFSSDGEWLAWLAWDHPNMPWDVSVLYAARVGPAGLRSEPRRIAGGDAALFQPRFAPDGRLCFVSDASGWWNLYAVDLDAGRAPAPLCPMQAEFGAPQWALGMSRYDFVDAHRLLCCSERDGVARLSLLDVGDGALRALALPFTSFESVRAEGGLACFVAAGPASTEAVYAYEIDEQRLHRLAGPREDDAGVEHGVARPETLEFDSAQGRRAQAFVYPPTSAIAQAPPDERPPLLVMSHGGPTGVAHPVLRASVQYWTSRGFAVADVNYAGSTSFGRAYRRQLDGAWGIADVEDCIAAARALARDGLADGARLLITGGSAGGFTTLCALTFHDDFRAGASHYGIGDLEALARDTHKFESRYTDRLVAPYPAARDVYRARSPLHHTDRLARPVIFFQGADDRVVPPEQARAMVAALAERGIPHAYVEFAGEGHGFRRAENIQRALERELAFYADVLGIEAAAAGAERAGDRW